MIKVNGVIINPTNFPDGTKLIKTFPAEDVEPWNRIEWFYESDDEMFILYCLVKHLEIYHPCALFLPYVPNARMDRVKNCEEVFTLKYFADFINSLNFIKVTILDPHSYVTPALIDRVEVIEPTDYINRAIAKSKPTVIFFPDEGAMKRYSNLIESDCGRVFGMKKRDWKTGKIEGLDIYGDINLLNGARVLIIDDICSRGGTFFHSALKLKEAGAANIDLYITHCEHTISEGELWSRNDLVNKIYTTNSIFHKHHERVEVFEV